MVVDEEADKVVNKEPEVDEMVAKWIWIWWPTLRWTRWST